MRPTGKLHLGHWVGALTNWVDLQDEYKCFFMIADWHALMSEYKDTARIPEALIDNAADWLAWGIDPGKAVLFVQSEIKEHLELFMILSSLTPLGWLFRCPTFKEQIRQLKDKDINTYAFLGYPVLQASDILLYRAGFVPVGEDQLPHLELTREIARRFKFIFKEGVFPEPRPRLTQVPRLMGLDGRKMSKSYGNYITLDESDENIREKILSMFTDPRRLKKQDKGHPDECNVCAYYKVFKPGVTGELYRWCTRAEKGCRECKAGLAGIIIELIAPRREDKKKILNRKDFVYNVLKEGNREAGRVAGETMELVKKAMKWIK